MWTQRPENKNRKKEKKKKEKENVTCKHYINRRMQGTAFYINPENKNRKKEKIKRKRYMQALHKPYVLVYVNAVP